MAVVGAGDCIPCQRKRQQIKQAAKDKDVVELVKQVSSGAAMLIGKTITMGGKHYRVKEDGTTEELE